MIIDVAAFIGAYPFRHLADTSASALLRDMDRVGIDRAWVGYLTGIWHHDPRPGNKKLDQAIAAHDRLSAVYTIDPTLPGWMHDVEMAAELGAVGIRVYPMHQGHAPDGSLMQEVVGSASQSKLPVLLTVRLEDLRQRHPLDVARDLPASSVRHLARSGSDVRLIVTHAGREYIEEIHFGLTEEEQRHVCYDISWLWGPPSGDLSTLCKTVGVDRFVWGSGAPLRMIDAPGAKLDLSNVSAEERVRIESSNLVAFLANR